ncbi:serine hydrolase domain-containing protein [Chryseosolibacter indicus]|uniref:Beta-lactamase family protein n=1 Tax=Chryseosolibacter indicus TaxID=2782351 RepID=A0ABS5VNZ0_9BACT|nr:serine hydrolase domain-containing protein [Chryseosolibacter indicus]MBT1703165.1 beta-lactamase family protein [Chryseosolibacter indicus]
MKDYFKGMKDKKRRIILLTLVVAVIAVVAYIFYPVRTLNKPSVTKKNTVIKRLPNPHIPGLIEAYEKELDKLFSISGTPGAAIAIVKDSTIVYMKGFGVKASNKKGVVDQNTVFRIASVSKCFASFLTGILVEDHILQWNDPVIKYLPEFSLYSPEQTKLLTISNVLSHTTGLPYHTYTNLVEEGIELNLLLDRLKEVKPSSEIGKEYSYQNVAYSLIGGVIQKATGKMYETEIKERVFAPLGMKNASIDYKTLLANPNIAEPHRRTRQRWVPAKITDTYYNVAPAGGINASINDMAQWMIALLGHRKDVISRTTLDELYKPFILARSKNRNYRKLQKLTKSYYGLGWRILHYPNDTLIYHGGYVNGYRSEVALNPKDDIAICILANSPGELADNGIPVFFGLYNEYREKILAWDKQEKLKYATPAL